tara:strand:- start:697 stop:1281 length:585 start_codon:yes stop_codon:yes gene_type:complete
MNDVWKFVKEVFDYESLPKDAIPEFAFWGRSNVGKSTLVNIITKSKLAKTSKTPGRTRSLVFFELEKKFRIVDFPGYGFSKIPENLKVDLDFLIDLYLNKRQNLKKIFLLIDSKVGFKQIDELILKRLIKIFTGEICIVFTKIDKIKTKNIVIEQLKEISKKQKFLYKKFFCTSIHNGNEIILLKKFLFESIKS